MAVKGMLGVLKLVLSSFDDVSSLTLKVGAKATVPVMVDDITAVAGKTTKFTQDREIPLLFKMFFIALLMIIPLATIVYNIKLYFGFLIPILLLLGGTYLGYEAIHTIKDHYYSIKAKITGVSNNYDGEQLTEKELLISSSITTFVLLLEIVVIALNSIMESTSSGLFINLELISIGAVIFIYLVVLVLVRIDNLGIYVILKTKDKEDLLNKFFYYVFGVFLVKYFARYLMVIITFVGMLAMAYIAGEIYLHNVDFIHHLYVNNLNFMPEFVFILFLGVLIGFITVLLFDVILGYFKLMFNK